MSEGSPTIASPPRGFRPFRAWLDLFSNVWFGVTLLVIMFVYSFVGSAGIIYPAALSGQDGVSWNLLSAEGWRHTFPREFFDVSEMQWFGADAGWIWFPLRWQQLPPWAFRMLILTFCTAMTTVTLRRIRLNWVNAGVWMIHTGIVTLCIGSTIYFGWKFEGEISVMQRDALITVPGVSEPVRMRIQPGAKIEAGTGSNRYVVEVAGLNPRYAMMTEPYVGTEAYAITFRIQAPGGKLFIRQVLVDYPQFTEDIVMDDAGRMSRAIEALGKRLSDENLKIKLEYSPVKEFYLHNRPALYARIANGDGRQGVYDEEGWVEMPLGILPRYGDRLSSDEGLWLDGEHAKPKMNPFVIEAGTLAGDIRLEVTDYLLYADISTRWTDASPEVNPRVAFTLFDEFPGGEPQKFRLFANRKAGGSLDMFRSDFMKFIVNFRWIEDPAEIPDLVPDPAPELEVEVVDANVKKTIRLSDLYGRPKPLAIEGTPYTIRLISVFAGDQLGFLRSPDGNPPSAMAVIRITSPTKGEFTRMVAFDRDGLVRDIDAGRGMPSELLDSNIKVRALHAAPPRLVIVSGPGSVGTQAIYRHASGAVVHKPLVVGKDTTLTDRELAIRMTSRLTRAQLETKARIVPPRERQSLANVGQVGKSLVYAKVHHNGKTQGVWIPFSAYVFENQYRQPLRRVTLADGRTVELLYCRERQELPTWVALERFTLETYTGGSNPRGFHSSLRFANGDGWSEPVKIRENEPAEFAGYWFFQSTWDPPSTDERRWGGWNHTGLGVGNREGIGTMLFGTCLSIVGMIYAFYVKPVIKRRRREAVLASPGKEKA